MEQRNGRVGYMINTAQKIGYEHGEDGPKNEQDTAQQGCHHGCIFAFFVQIMIDTRAHDEEGPWHGDDVEHGGHPWDGDDAENADDEQRRDGVADKSHHPVKAAVVFGDGHETAEQD